MMVVDPTGQAADVDAVTQRDDSPHFSGYLQVRILDFSAGITSNSPTLLRDLARLFPDSSPNESNCDLSAQAIAWHVRRLSVERASQYSVLDARGRSVSLLSKAAVLGWIEFAVEEAVTESLTDYLLIHAGSIVGTNGGLVFPGASGAGKSTLVAALDFVGFPYFSDEIAVVDGRSVRLQRFPRAICLKKDGVKVLADAYPDWQSSTVRVDRTDGQRAYYVAARRHYLGEAGAPIRHVVIPDRRPGAPTRLEPVSRARAVFELARHSLNLPRHGGAGIEVISRIVEEADCYRLIYDNLRDAVDAISPLTGPVSRRGPS